MNHSGIRQEDGRGVLILILGILSLTTLGPLAGIPAWVMANTDLKKIEQGIISRSEQSFTRAGKIMGIISTALLGVIVIGIATVVFINVIASGGG